MYFAAVGGAAALLGAHVIAAEPVAWPELGTEALVRLTLSDFPAFVAIDATRRRPVRDRARRVARRDGGRAR